MKKRITIKSPKRIQKNVLLDLIQRVLQAEKNPKGLNLVLADDDLLSQLNERFKGRNGPTDVLSFPFDEEDFLGEIYVSLDRAKEQALEYNATEDEEVQRLVLHGLLHLLGYNHRQMPARLKRYL